MNQDTLIKICGVTNAEDAHFALEAGADWVGFNLVAGPRQIDVSTARGLLNGLDDPSRAVLLLRVEEAGFSEEVAALLADFPEPLAQLYGTPKAEHIRELVEAGRRCLYVHRVQPGESFGDVEELLDACAPHLPAYLLLDAKVEDALGGTGHAADWDTIERARATGLLPEELPMILAGGLTPDTVPAAIRRLRPAGVDVSSGVESEPGWKDPELVRAFVDAVRGVG